MRTIIWFIYFGLSTMLTIPDLAKANRFERQKRTADAYALANKRARKWAMSLIRLTGSSVTVKGEENIPATGPVLFVSNHQSNFDIPLMIGYVNGDKGFISKIEMTKMMVVSSWMKHLKCVFMDRKDMRQSLKAIREGINTLKEGYNLVLFPEGTRSQTGEVMDFKAGGFKLASKSKATIVPVAINGSINMMKKGSIKIQPATVKITILPPIEITDENKNDTAALSETVRNVIIDELKFPVNHV